MNTYQLSLPLSLKEIRKLHVGDIIFLSGKLFTARDEAHQQLLDIPIEKVPFDLDSLGLYHCGPLMKKKESEWQVIAAGPTTSSRLELFEADLIKKFPSINVIIGKGGMGNNTLNALRNHGIYLSYTGGAAALAADQILKVEDVFWLDKLGMAEAVWVFSVDSFGPLIVGIDAHGKSLFQTK